MNFSILLFVAPNQGSDTITLKITIVNQTWNFFVLN